MLYWKCFEKKWNTLLAPPLPKFCWKKYVTSSPNFWHPTPSMHIAVANYRTMLMHFVYTSYVTQYILVLRFQAQSDPTIAGCYLACVARMTAIAVWMCDLRMNVWSPCAYLSASLIFKLLRTAGAYRTWGLSANNLSTEAFWARAAGKFIS